MMRRACQTDLSNAEWALIEPHLPTPRAPGRPRVHSLREILNAIFYIVKSDCAWRLLPHEFPPRRTVYHYTSELGGWMEHGKGCTPLCASGCGCA
jgi:putative transposase